MLMIGVGLRCRCTMEMFKNLIVWQKAMELVRAVYALSKARNHRSIARSSYFGSWSYAYFDVKEVWSTPLYTYTFDLHLIRR